MVNIYYVYALCCKIKKNFNYALKINSVGSDTDI